MPTTLLMLPPQTPTTRAWASRLAAALPELAIMIGETEADAARAVGQTDAAFGTMPDTLLRDARRLRWLQAPQAAPRRRVWHARDRRGPAPARGAAGRAQARRARRARRAAAARGLRDPHGAPHSGHRGLHEPDALSADEALGVLHQYRTRHDDAARRSGRGAAGRRDRRRRARRLRAGAAAGRPSAVDDARRPHHAAYRRSRALSGRPALPGPARQLPALPGRRAAPQRGRQG